MSSTTASEPSVSPTFWDVAREAIRGRHHHDYTEGPIGRSIVLLAIPMILEMVLESVFAVTVAFSTLALASGAVFRLGRWKRVKV